MPNKSLTIEQILTKLAETPPRIAVLTAGLVPAPLHTAPSRNGWSANDVLAHLRACADVWGDCIEVILAQDTPTIRAVNPRTWIRKTDYLEQEFQPSLHAFATQRTDLLQGIGTVGTRRLVAYGDSYGGRKGARTDRAVLCAVACRS